MDTIWRLATPACVAERRWCCALSRRAARWCARGRAYQTPPRPLVEANRAIARKLSISILELVDTSLLSVFRR
jgi:hypothetical protein